MGADKHNQSNPCRLMLQRFDADHHGTSRHHVANSVLSCRNGDRYKDLQSMSWLKADQLRVQDFEEVPYAKDGARG